ncbi:MAG: threonine--tRNA ligase [Nanoarchaeota archaeon]
MKILTLHCDYINFTPKKKALKSIPELSEKDKKEKQIKECLVVLTAVESGDSEKELQESLSAIKKNSEQVNTKNIVVYPYAHLSSNLSTPKQAQEYLNKTAEELKKSGFNIETAPFGYYKEFELKVKGHPLSELSKEFGNKKIIKIDEEKETENDETEALKAEEKLKSYWHIMTPDGKLHDVGKFDYKKHKNLKKFATYEKSKSRKVVKEPAHIKLMRKLELVDYEPGSDSGNLRYYPKGKMIKALIEEFVTDKVLDYGGMEVETPIMYDIKNPILEKYLQKFPARQYQIESDKKTFFLRFAACFGQFLMAKDAGISYKDLPFKLYELTRYSFRKEQKGELSGLRRLRSFTMPDVHALCRDLKQAMDEYKTRFNLCLNVLDNMGLDKNDVELAIRFTKDFYNKNKKFVEYLVKTFGKPVLVEMWDERPFYFILKYELNFVDSVDKAAALSTDQIDVDNAERYGMMYTDRDNKRKYPYVLHCSPSGAIERVMYALLEKSELSGKHSLPYWLSPTQIRLLPVSDKFNDKAIELAEELKKEKIRADVDDRNETSKRKIVDSEKEWVPFTIFVGDKELKENKFKLRIRGESGLKDLTKEELLKKLKKLQGEMPWRPLPMNILLSKRPTFVG